MGSTSRIATSLKSHNRPSEALTAMLLRFKDLEAAWLSAAAREEAARSTAEEDYPNRDPSLFIQQEASDLDGNVHVSKVPLSVGDIMQHIEIARMAGGEYSKAVLANEQRLRDLQRWYASCRCVDAQYSVPALEEATKRAAAAMKRAQEDLIEAPVKSIGDVLLKLKFADELESCREAAKRATASDLLLARIVVGLIDDLEDRQKN